MSNRLIEGTESVFPLWKRQLMANINPRVAVISDPKVCSGCGCCELICSLKHAGECNPRLSTIRVTRDVFGMNYIPETCRQCPDTPCVVACQVEGAMMVDSETGVVVIDSETCVGCGRCAEACKYGVIAWAGLGTMARKCDLCGGAPECITYCPRQALHLMEWTAGTEKDHTHD